MWCYESSSVWNEDWMQRPSWASYAHQMIKRGKLMIYPHPCFTTFSALAAVFNSTADKPRLLFDDHLCWQECSPAKKLLQPICLPRVKSPSTTSYSLWIVFGKSFQVSVLQLHFSCSNSSSIALIYQNHQHHQLPKAYKIQSLPIGTLLMVGFKQWGIFTTKTSTLTMLANHHLGFL